MSMNQFIIIILFSFFMCCISCEDNIINNFEDPPPKIVVDGMIEQGKYPKIFLTWSTSFIQEIDSNDFVDLIITKAKVTISTNEASEVLTLTKDNTKFPPYYYKGTKIKGRVGKQYNLEVILKDQKVTASTTIPEPPVFDSIWYKPRKTSDTLGSIHIKFTDNAGQKNYYRTFYKRLNTDNKFFPTYLNTYDDQYFNGETIEFILYKGFAEISSIHQNNKYFRQNDTLIIKFCSLDKQHFEFWNAYQGKILNATSFSVSSTNPIPSNINGGLGIWGGYGATYYYLITKP